MNTSDTGIRRRHFITTIAGLGAAAALSPGLAAAQTPAAPAAGAPARRGRLKQAVCRGVFNGSKLDFEGMCREAARLGLWGFDLVGTDALPMLKKHGLIPTMVPGGSGIKSGINDPKNHADIEPKMIAVLEKRALKAGMINRIERRLCKPDWLHVENLRESVDLAAVIHMLHETPDQGKFLEEIRQALKKDGRLLIIEPRGHVSKQDFENSVALAPLHGFTPDGQQFDLKGRKILLQKI